MLVGRDAECARLAAALSAARDGRGGAAVLVGEPGIGKTTLLRWAVERAEGMTVLAARGIESEAELPYAALVDLLTPIVHRLDALPEAQATVLMSALGLGPPGATDRFAVGVATLGLLAAAAEEGTVLVAVDDLQWVDSASQAALAFSARRLAALPAFFVAAQRRAIGDTSLLLPDAEVVALNPLAPADAAQLLAASGDIAPDVAVTLLGAARGNPLALVELPQLLTPGQLGGAEPLVDPIPTKNGLERAFSARLAPLSVQGRRAAVGAAADGSGTLRVVLRALGSLGLDERALSEVEALGLVRLDGNEIEFRHPLVRSAAYHGADPAERRLVHAALATADDDPDRRVWHLAATALGPDEAVASELERAGDRALARGAFGAAAAAFERAASLTPEREARGMRLVRAASALDETGSLARSEAFAREAAELIEDPRAIARAVRLIASSKMGAGEVETAYSMLLDAAEQVEELDPAWAAAMFNLAANLPLFRLQAPAAVELIERAWALGDPARPRMLVEKVSLAFGKVIAGDTAGSAMLIELAREATANVSMGHRQTSALGWPLVWVEEYGAARTLLTWALEAQRQGGSLRYLPQSLHPLAELDFRVGRWVPALAQVYEAIDLLEETGQHAEQGFARATAARIEAALGRDEECRAHAREAFAADAASGLLFATAYAGAALGLLELGRGDPEAAIVALEPVERIVRDGEVGEPWIVHWAPDLVEACSHAGRFDRAKDVLDTFESQALATQRTSARAAALRCRGILAADDAYADCFVEALDFHDRLPTPFERARTELAFGERLRRTGHRTDARDRLQSALQTFERLGAKPWAERARVELRASGQSVRTEEERAQEALTPQELQVAALVAGGATNREAAATLFLSAKTIEFHLGNVYRKLGIRSRTELARVVDAA
jgi:DNA-binding CsgD family transcriptional regulator